MSRPKAPVVFGKKLKWDQSLDGWYTAPIKMLGGMRLGIDRFRCSETGRWLYSYDMVFDEPVSWIHYRIGGQLHGENCPLGDDHAISYDPQDAAKDVERFLGILKLELAGLGA